MSPKTFLKSLDHGNFKNINFIKIRPLIRENDRRRPLLPVFEKNKDENNLTYVLIFIYSESLIHRGDEYLVGF